MRRNSVLLEDFEAISVPPAVLIQAETLPPSGGY